MEYYYDVPEMEKPVSLQPYKTLKIIFMVLAIVTTAFLIIYGAICGVLGVVFHGIDTAFDTDLGDYLGVMPGLALLSYVPFCIAFWVLFIVFNVKYRKRVAHNRRLGLN